MANQKELELLNQGGKIIFIRHAYAPGVGDPSNFSFEDCETQRNLNQQGIEQSILLGSSIVCGNPWYDPTVDQASLKFHRGIRESI